MINFLEKIPKVSKYIVICLFFLIPIQSHAIGITPPTIDLGDIQTNQSIEQTITILRTPDEVDELTVDIKFRGTGTDYISGKGITIPEGQRTGEINFIITPGSEAVGDYQIFIDFYSNSVVSHGEDTLIINGATAEVSFSVLQEYEPKFDVDKFVVMEDVSSMSLFFDVSNKSSIELKPDRIELSVRNVDHSWSDAFTIRPKDDQIIKPGQTITFEKPIAYILPYGQYEINTFIVYQGQKIYNDTRAWSYGDAAVNKEVKTVSEKHIDSKITDYWWIAGILIVVFVVLVIAFFDYRHPKKKKHGNKKKA